MGISSSAGVSKGKKRFSSSYRPMSEINVTPFVDVMLVLLIIFMVTAPLLTVGVNVNLPKTQASAIRDDSEPLVVTLNAKGKIYVQEKEVELEKFIPLLEAVSKNNHDMKIFIKGDKTLPYQDVMQVMGRMSAAGFEKVALIADLPEKK